MYRASSLNSPEFPNFPKYLAPMPSTIRLTTDKRELAAFLCRDPVWAAYAIGDLEDALFADTTWYLAGDDAARGLVLLYRGLEPTVLLTMGEVDDVAAVLANAPMPDRVSLAALREHLPAIAAHYDFSTDRVRPMLRMVVEPEAFRSASERPTAGALRRLTPDDLPEIEALYTCGGAFAPDAFHPRQLAEGVFYGVTAGGRPEALLAVAGTHLVSRTDTPRKECQSWETSGVAAVGNVYTHPAWRGQGLARLAASAVTAELLRRGLLVVLNVDQDNLPAISLYRQLGFREHCPFVEGIGVARNP